MKKLFLLSLFLCFYSVANATVDCTSLTVISATDTELTIGLPTSPSCTDPTFRVSMRETAVGGAYLPVFTTVDNPAPGVFTTVITGLTSCTEYDFLVEVFCDGLIEGGCYTGLPFKTTGCAPGGINCYLLSVISVSDHGMIIQLPTRIPCVDPNYVIKIRAFGSGDPFTLATSTNYPVGGGNYHGNISGLDPCTDYEVEVTLFCDGEVSGICVNGEAFTTSGDCDDPCDDCINFLGIAILEESGCDYLLYMDYAVTPECGTITILSEEWNFDDGITGEGISVSHSFPGDGTYEVTAVIRYYSSELDMECESTETLEINVAGCVPECETCKFEECIELDVISTVVASGCNYEFVMGYTLGDCGEISDVSTIWDFGYPGGTGTGVGDGHVFHTFPGDGEYLVTGTITYTAGGVEHSCCLFLEVHVTGCCTFCADAECFPLDEIATLGSSGCNYVFNLPYMASPCGALTDLSTDWDWGHDGIGGTETRLGFGFIGHSFPEDGTYYISAVLTYTIDGIEYVCCLRKEIIVTGCDEGPKRGQIINETGQINASSGITVTTVPNPADDQVTITVLDPNNMSDANQLQLIIFDINGREVYNGNTIFGSQKMIDVSRFESGLYIYEVRDGETVILKEKLLIK